MRIVAFLLSSLICLLISKAAFAVAKCNDDYVINSLKPLYEGDWQFIKEVTIEDEVEDPITIRLYSGSKSEIRYCQSYYCLAGVVINHDEYRYVISVTFHDPETYGPRGEFSAILVINDYCIFDGKEALVNDTFINDARAASLSLIEDAEK